MARTPWSDGRGPLTDTYRETVFTLLLVLGFLGFGMQWAVDDPSVWYTVQSAYMTTVGGLSVVGGGSPGDVDQIRISRSTAERLNTVYRDLNTRTGDGVGEQAYCIKLDNGVMRVQQAGTIRADEDSVTYSISNCGVIDGSLHFHPPDSVPRLSDTDKETLVSSPYPISCVQSGLMSTVPGTTTGQLKCYRKPASGDVDDEFPEIPVIVAE